MQRNKLLIIIAVLAGIGLAISVYSFLHHFVLASGEFCNINEAFSCDIVNRGPYSRFFGVPVSLIGIIGYLLLGAAALVMIKQPQDKSLRWFLLLAAVGGLGFSLYLTSIEAFVLYTWCLLCVTSQVVMLLLFIVLMLFLRRTRQQNQIR